MPWPVLPASASLGHGALGTPDGLAVGGCLHTDFERGFIRAQTIGLQQLLEAGSLAEARTRGWLRSEGKEYVVAEGDVMEFLFNV